MGNILRGRLLLLFVGEEDNTTKGNRAIKKVSFPAGLIIVERAVLMIKKEPRDRVMEQLIVMLCANITV